MLASLRALERMAKRSKSEIDYSFGDDAENMTQNSLASPMPPKREKKGKVEIEFDSRAFVAADSHALSSTDRFR